MINCEYYQSQRQDDQKGHTFLFPSLSVSLSHTPCRILQIMLFNTETSISVEMHGNYNNVLKDQSERAVWPLAGSMADKRWLLIPREKGWSIMRAAWGQDGKGVIKCKKNLKQVKVFLCQTVKKKQKQGHVSEVNKDTSKRCWWVTAQDVHTVGKNAIFSSKHLKGDTGGCFITGPFSMFWLRCFVVCFLYSTG